MTKLTNRMIERAAIGLVLWSLSKRGFDCQEVYGDGKNGDIWVKTPSGKMASIEVKGGASPGWRMPVAQASAADFYIFADVNRANCWILSKSSLSAVLSGCGLWGNHPIYTVPANKLPKAAHNAWHEIDQAPAPQRRKPRGTATYRHTRTVTSTLKDGTKKTYKYKPDGSTEIQIHTNLQTGDATA